MSIKHNYSHYRGISEKIASIPHLGLPHMGAGFFGIQTPDFGISEALGGVVGALKGSPSPTTYQGGSNLYGSVPQSPQQQQQQQQLANYQSSGGIAGVQSTRNTGGTKGVLGTSTANYGSAPSMDGAQQNVDRQAEALRNSINSNFDSIFSQLDQQAGLLPQWQQEDLNTINNTVGNLRSGIQTGLSNANQAIQLDKDQIQTGVNKSVTDIQNNLRGLLKNAQGVIGAYGAGSSSVTNNTLPYAFSKMFAQQRGNIQGQANGQFVELDKKALDVQNTFNQQKMQIDQWENDQLTSTKDKYRNMLSQIGNAKINATGQRAQALQSLQTNILTQAQNELLAIQNEAANTRQSIQQWALQRSNDLSGLQASLAQNAAYDPRAITYNAMGGLQGGQSSQYTDFLNPFATQKKEQDKNQF